MNKGLINLIATNKLFEGLDVSNINFDNINGNLLTFSEGTLIFSEGDASAEVYLVMDGKVNIIRKSILGAKGDEIFEKDSFFGFEEFIEQVNRISTAVALEDSYLIAFNKEETRALIRQNDRLKENIVKYSNIPDVDVIHRFLVEEELKEEGIAFNKTEAGQTETVKEEESKQETVAEEKEDIVEPTDVDLNLDLLSPPIGEEDHEEEDLNIEEELLNFYDSPQEITTREEKEEPAEEKEEPETLQSPYTEQVTEQTAIEHPVDLWEEDEETVNTTALPDVDFTPPSPFEEEEEIPTAEPTEEIPAEGNVQEEEEEIREETEKEIPVSESFVPPRETIDFSAVIEEADKIFLSSNEKELIENFKLLSAKVLGAKIAFFFLPDGKGNLTATYLKGEESLTLTEPVEESTVGICFKENKPQIVSLPEDWESLQTKALQDVGIDITSIFCYPVRVDKRNVGVLVLINKDEGNFNDEDFSKIRRLKNLFDARLSQLDFNRSQFLSLKENIYGRLVDFLSKKIKDKITVAQKYSEKALEEDDNKELIGFTVEQLEEAKKSVAEIDLLKVEEKDLHLVEIKLTDFLEKFLGENEELFKAKYINVFKYLEGDAFVKIDSQLMTIALKKICDNAIEAMPFGGNIIVKTFPAEEETVITFTDNGNGIEEENLPLIFEPFIAFSKDGHSGLGLAIAKKIIEAHNGSVTVKPNEKEGVTVEVKLRVVEY